jgi:alpha-D-ribose 1-methylphosphonate 5-triphosphate synthase subunit PhnH
MGRSHAIRWLEAAVDDRLPETFRAIMKALDHPGTIVQLESCETPPAALHSASAAVIEALIHSKTAVWTDLDWNSLSADWLQSVCSGCLVTEPCMAAFALVTQPSRMPPLFQFSVSQEDRPEASTTLILQVTGFSAPHGETLALPGTHRRIRIAPAGLPAKFWSEWKNQNLLQNLGVDIFFTWKNAVMALPRNIRLA